MNMLPKEYFKHVQHLIVYDINIIRLIYVHQYFCGINVTYQFIRQIKILPTFKKAHKLFSYFKIQRSIKANILFQINLTLLRFPACNATRTGSFVSNGLIKPLRRQLRASEASQG